MNYTPHKKTTWLSKEIWSPDNLSGNPNMIYSPSLAFFPPCTHRPPHIHPIWTLLLILTNFPWMSLPLFHSREQQPHSLHYYNNYNHSPHFFFSYTPTKNTTIFLWWHWPFGLVIPSWPIFSILQYSLGCSIEYGCLLHERWCTQLV